MKMKNWLTHGVATGALALGSQAAQAAIICQGCEYGDDVGTYLGSYNPTIDVGSNTAFEDFWVFDLDPGGSGSISADFTAFTAISGFHGDLYPGLDAIAQTAQTFWHPVGIYRWKFLSPASGRISGECRRMRSRAGQRVPVWLQMIIVVVCATAMVIAADAEDYCGATAKCIVAIGKG